MTSLLDPPTGVGVVVRELLDGLRTRPDVAVTAFAVSWRGRARLASVVGPNYGALGQTFNLGTSELPDLAPPESHQA